MILHYRDRHGKHPWISLTLCLMKAEKTCELCGRIVPELTRHHLIPRTHHGNRRVRKLFSRDEMQRKILNVCRPCHSHIHQTIDEKQLAVHFHTRSRLLSHPDIERFVKWIASKPTTFHVRGCSWKRRHKQILKRLD